MFSACPQGMTQPLMHLISQISFFVGECLRSERGEALLKGVGTLRFVPPPNASVQWHDIALARAHTMAADHVMDPTSMCNHKPVSAQLCQPAMQDFQASRAICQA